MSTPHRRSRRRIGTRAQFFSAPTPVGFCRAKNPVRRSRIVIVHTMESSAQSTKQGGFKKQKRAPIPDANENVVTLLHTGAANKRIKTSESSDFNFFLQLPTCVFEYLCEWLNGDDILRLVHCGRRDTSARIYAHADKLVFGGKCRPWSVLQFVRELLPFAAHLRHLEIDVMWWPERRPGPCSYSYRWPSISFEKLEYLGFPDVDGARPSLCVSFRFIDGLPLSKTLKTLDLSGWNYCFPSPFDSLPFSFFGHFSNLECLLLPQQKMPWNYFKFTSATPSSVTNLNLIANVNLDQFRGIFGANFGKNMSMSVQAYPLFVRWPFTFSKMISRILR